MAGPAHLLEINPALDRAALSARFAADGRVQIRDILTEASARTLHGAIARETEWGMAFQDGSDGPRRLRRAEVAALPPARRREIGERLTAAMQGRDYAFHYAQYPFLEAYRERWHPGGPHDVVFEHLNAQPMLDLVRAVTGIDAVFKADAQATLFGPHHFLAVHDDGDPAGGRRVAYVLNLCAVDWRPDWGGYLNFLDDDGDVVAGYRPRFNALNLFAVPLLHHVTYVPPFAPAARFAITGWFRDR